MGNKRVVITGMGTITPIGNNLSEYASALKNGVSGCKEIKSFDTSKFLTGIDTFNIFQFINIFRLSKK